MRMETALAVAIGVVVVTSLVAAVLVPGVLAEAEDDPVEPSHASVADATIATEEVAADEVTLTVTARLDHRGGESEGLYVRVDATQADSGLHAATEVVTLDTLEGDEEVEVPVEVTVPREGDYEFEIWLYDDGERQDGLERRVGGVGSLNPPQAETSVQFHRFAGTHADVLDPVQVSVDEEHGDEVSLELTAYLTNDGADETDDLEVEFVVRQNDSSLVTIRDRAPVGEIEPGHTETPSTTVVVPDGFNYYVDAVLWQDGVIVGDARGVANLDVDRPLTVDDETADAGIEVEEGEDRRASPPDTPRPDEAAEEETPGFGVVVTLAALAGVLLLATHLRRRS